MGDESVSVTMDGSVPAEVMALAERLAAIHSCAVIHNGANGIHISIPDPELLETNGAREFTSRHLQINAEKYLGIGRYDVDVHRTRENVALYNKYRRKGLEVPCAVSQHSQKNYWVRDLLSNYKPVEERGLALPYIPKYSVTGAVTGENNLVDDGFGAMVPAWCGDTVPLHELPQDHPAVQYIARRRYNVEWVSKAYGLCYCTKAVPQDRSKGVVYSPVTDGLRNTYEGRVIIPVRVDGHVVGYQGRAVELKASNGTFVWNGASWVIVKDADGNSTLPEGRKLNKYMSAAGMARNRMLFGYDQAAMWNLDNAMHGPRSRCVVVEGPLDALRIGPPAVAVLGASMSRVQAAMIAGRFSRVIIAGDNDKAGGEAVGRIMEALKAAGVNMALVDAVKVPSGKDLGDMETKAALELIQGSPLWN